MKKKITKETFAKWLKVFFPKGHTGNLDKFDSEWFLGWFCMNIESTEDVVMEINLDGGNSAIVFWLIYKNNFYTPEEVAYYLRGMMLALAPEMVCENDFSETNDTMVFEYKEE